MSKRPPPEAPSGAKRIGKKTPQADLLSSSVDETAVAKSPLMMRLKEGWGSQIMQDWLAACDQTAIPLGGIEAFSEERYKIAMQDGEYHCTVSATSILPTDLTHKHLIPGMAAVNKVMDTVWCREKAERGGTFEAPVSFSGLPRESVAHHIYSLVKLRTALEG